MLRPAPLEGEDFVEYHLYTSSSIQDLAKDREEIINLLSRTTFFSNHIWQKDDFELRLWKPEDHKEFKGNIYFINYTVDSFHHLFGITRFGDNIEDEWLIVYLLFELSKKIKGLVIR